MNGINRFIIQALCKEFMEFILLVERMKCWYNTPLQVLTNAPALDLLTISGREDVADILEFLFRNRGYLRELILHNCWLGDDSTGLLANIATMYPDLERLSLNYCHPLISYVYYLFPRWTEHSGIQLPSSKVDYMYGKLLGLHVCIREAWRRTPLEIRCVYLSKKEMYCSFKLCCIISILC